ncbi:unnamed protein product, partial [Ectocarpus sp. 12 AP-2014]
SDIRRERQTGVRDQTHCPSPHLITEGKHLVPVQDHTCQRVGFLPVGEKKARKFVLSSPNGTLRFAALHLAYMPPSDVRQGSRFAMDDHSGAAALQPATSGSRGVASRASISGSSSLSAGLRTAGEAAPAEGMDLGFEAASSGSGAGGEVDSSVVAGEVIN